LSSPVLQSFLKNLRDALQMSLTIEKVPEVDALLKIGAKKASVVADGVLAKVRVKLSFEAF
jgi:hypothetical protein